MKRSKRHRRYLHFQMDVILSLRVKIRTRTKEAKEKRDYFVVSAFLVHFQWHEQSTGKYKGIGRILYILKETVFYRPVRQYHLIIRFDKRVHGCDGII